MMKVKWRGALICSIKYPRNSRNQSLRVENVLVDLFSRKTTNSISMTESYVNIAEFVDIICCSLSATRFTMVFGKFFAFFRNQKQRLLHVQVF